MFWPFRNSNSFSVHATVAEPAELLCAFVAHYVAMGAAEILLYLDRPDQKAERILARVPQVKLTVCDDAYWANSKLGERPALHTRRQNHNANHAYKRCKAAWFLFCDADEFVHSDRDFGAILADTPRNVPFLRIAVAERAYSTGQVTDTIFDGVFRSVIAAYGKVGADIYGDFAGFYGDGMLGHRRGKTVTRTGKKLRISLHTPMKKAGEISNAEMAKDPDYQRFMPDTWLLHFDGLTKLHWTVKLAKKYRDAAAAGHGAKVDLGKRHPSRIRQIRAIMEAPDTGHAVAELGRLTEVTETQAAKLDALGAFHMFTPEIAATARALFPELGLDYSAATFDARLREMHAETIASLS